MNGFIPFGRASFSSIVTLAAIIWNAYSEHQRKYTEASVTCHTHPRVYDHNGNSQSGSAALLHSFRARFKEQAAKTGLASQGSPEKSKGETREKKATQTAEGKSRRRCKISKTITFALS